MERNQRNSQVTPASTYLRDLYKQQKHQRNLLKSIQKRLNNMRATRENIISLIDIEIQSIELSIQQMKTRIQANWDIINEIKARTR